MPGGEISIHIHKKYNISMKGPVTRIGEMILDPECLENDFHKFKFLPLICYEIIYSGSLSKDFDFNFILNISEDGWFGKSIGPEQHFAHSIFRAIETGKYVLRSANNGTAAIINPLGQIEENVSL